MISPSLKGTSEFFKGCLRSLIVIAGILLLSGVVWVGIESLETGSEVQLLYVRIGSGR
jgi:hypothetical protein